MYKDLLTAMSKPTNLYESLFILHKCVRNIQTIMEVIMDNKDNIEEFQSHGLILANYLMMEATSFLEEFKHGLTKAEQPYKERIIQVRQINSPIVAQIDKWGNLYKFRSQIIAHQWRDKDGRFVIPDLTIQNIPRNWMETVYLGILVNNIFEMIHKEFHSEFMDALKYVESLTPLPKPPTDYSSFNNKIDEMAKKVNLKCMEYNKNYSFAPFFANFETK